jgi:hypothetical protein
MTKDISKDKLPASGITKASAYYCDKFGLRAAIQVVPVLGGSLDTLLAGLGTKYQYQRLEHFISELHQRFAELEQSINPKTVEAGEPLFDFTMQVFDHVIKTRSEEKRKQFANLFANQIAKKKQWDEAETAARLLQELNDWHIKILVEAINAPICDDAWKGLRVIMLKEYKPSQPERAPTIPPFNISSHFPE